jgi:hypothetical protein
MTGEIMFKKIIFLVMILPFTCNATNFSEIASFAERICDRVEASGTIESTKVMGQLTGEAKALIRLIGGTVGVDGSITIENTTYKGLPFDKLPEQMSDARECRKELALVLLEGREIVQRIQSESTTVLAKYKVNRKDFDVNLMLQPDFKAFVDLTSRNKKFGRLIDGTKLELLNESFTENLGPISVDWRKVRVLTGEHANATGWLPASNISEI